jgi:hypothetical protein
MGYENAGKNAMLDHLGTLITHLGLHTAFPATSGNELTGGSPAYARKAASWGAAASGSMDLTPAPVFDVPAAQTVVSIGFWSALTVGTLYGASPLGNATPSPFTAVGGTDLFTSDAHGLANNDKVILIDSVGAALPTGVTQGTIYYVRDVSGDTFKLAATEGGAAIDITTDGAGFVVKVVPETFGAQGTLTVSDLDLDLNALAA